MLLLVELPAWGTAVKRLIEMETSPGRRVMVEVDVEEATEGVAPAARIGELAAKAGSSFEDAFANVRPVAESIVRVIGTVSVLPDEVEVTFGLKMSVDAGAIIASTSAEANFAVKLCWHTIGDRLLPGSDPG